MLQFFVRKIKVNTKINCVYIALKENANSWGNNDGKFFMGAKMLAQVQNHVFDKIRTNSTFQQ